jgi:hypothetical protein
MHKEDLNDAAAAYAAFANACGTAFPSRRDNTFENSCRDGGIRTRGLLLPNQLCPDAGRRRMLPAVVSTCINCG